MNNAALKPEVIKVTDPIIRHFLPPAGLRERVAALSERIFDAATRPAT